MWGVATSAYQIEGARNEDGKGESIWDRFSDQGRLHDPGDVAADHYHRWEEDLDLFADRGVPPYRFSVAWTRIIPDGDGEVNRAGLCFYGRLISGMRDRFLPQLRFGMVDGQAKDRLPKRSFDWYATVARKGTLPES